jgi:hypothetical protein
MQDRTKQPQATLFIQEDPETFLSELELFI